MTSYVYVERLVRFFCGAEPLLRSVPAWDLAVDEQRKEALTRVWTSSSSSCATGRAAKASCSARRPRASSCRGLRVEIDADHGAWIGQEPVALSTHPTVVDGRLERATSTCVRSSSAGACCRAA